MLLMKEIEVCLIKIKSYKNEIEKLVKKKLNVFRRRAYFIKKTNVKGKTGPYK